MIDDLETLAFEAKRLASISFRLAESMLGRCQIGPDGLREYQLNDDQVNDLMFLLGEQADAAAAIEREAQLVACLPRYFRMNQQLSDRILAMGDAERAWKARLETEPNAEEVTDGIIHADEWLAWREAEDAFLAEPCKTMLDTLIKLRVVIDDPQMQAGLVARWIGQEDGALVFIRSLMPQVDEGDNASS